jgi:DNA-binding response OmpR family regulator
LYQHGLSLTFRDLPGEKSTFGELMSRITLFALPEDLERALARVLREEAHKVVRKVHVQDLRHGPKSDALFLSADHPDFRATLSQLRENHPELPVIAVTRVPETAHWLDALDAGATDYCGAPFERVQIRWILNSVIRTDGQVQRRATAAA